MNSHPSPNSWVPNSPGSGEFKVSWTERQTIPNPCFFCPAACVFFQADRCRIQEKIYKIICPDDESTKNIPYDSCFTSLLGSNNRPRWKLGRGWTNLPSRVKKVTCESASRAKSKCCNDEYEMEPGTHNL